MGNYVTEKDRIWSNFTIPYALGEGISQPIAVGVSGAKTPGATKKLEPTAEQVAIETAIAEWNRVLANVVQWRPATNKDTHRVVFVKSDGNNRSESIGRSNKPEQKLNVNLPKVHGLRKLGNVSETGVLLHEMAHAAGLQHEHQRTDRDQHVRVVQSNVARCCEFRLSEDTKGCKCMVQFVGCTPYGAYDYQSIMHYMPTQGGKDNKVVLIAIDKHGQPRDPQPTMGGMTTLQSGDIATLRKLYRGG